jgi:hypothetical protein
MSLHFDLVIVCDLREDTPEPCVEYIQWLFTRPSDSAPKPQFDCPNEYGLTFDDPFLYPLPTEEVISVFQKKYRYTRSPNAGGGDVYRYAIQFSARDILDDGFYEDHLNFVAWLATLAEEGFIGYYKEELAFKPELLYVKNRQLVIE